MQSFRPLAVVMLLGCLPALAACSSGTSPSSGGSVASAIDNSVQNAMDRAQEELRTRPIEVSHNDPNLPVAKITPDGDFIVGGKTVAITPAQRSALLEYRAQMIAVASAGIAIGKQGAALGIRAASEAISGAFSGKSEEEIRQKVEAQTTGIRQSVATLCDRLPHMMDEQQKLAAAVPAFKPYATMTQKDIDDCRKDALHDDDANRAQVQQSIRDRIHIGIRSGVQTAAQTAGLASHGTPDAGQPASASSTN